MDNEKKIIKIINNAIEQNKTTLYLSGYITTKIIEYETTCTSEQAEKIIKYFDKRNIIRFFTIIRN